MPTASLSAVAFPGWISGFPLGVCAQEPLRGRQHWVPIIQQVHLWSSRRSCCLERGFHPIQGGPRRRAGHRGRPAAHEPAPQQMRSLGTGQPLQTSGLSLQGLRLRVHADLNATRNLADKRDMFLWRSRHDTSFYAGQGLVIRPAAVTATFHVGSRLFCWRRMSLFRQLQHSESKLLP